MLSKRVSLFLIAYLIVGFFFLAVPEKGYSGGGIPPSELGCCQFGDNCETITSSQCFEDTGNLGFFPEGICDENTSQCIVRSGIPTLSEWGLIAMAGVLGIVGFMVIRRRKVTV